MAFRRIDPGAGILVVVVAFIATVAFSPRPPLPSVHGFQYAEVTLGGQLQLVRAAKTVTPDRRCAVHLNPLSYALIVDRVIKSGGAGSMDEDRKDSLHFQARQGVAPNAIPVSPGWRVSIRRMDPSGAAPERKEQEYIYEFCEECESIAQKESEN